MKMRIQSTTSRSLGPMMGISCGDMVCVMGAGGKATIMKRLIREMLDERFPVIITSTTNLHALGGENAPHVLLSEEGRFALQSATQDWAERGAVVWVEKKLPQNMFRGLDVSQVEALGRSDFHGVIIVKTDGARKRLIKAPGPHEPVVPQGATHCVLVLGLIAVGREANEKTIHRMEKVCSATGLKAGDVIEPRHLAILASHPSSYPLRFPQNAKKILYLSHCASKKSLHDAQAVCSAIPDGAYDLLIGGDSVSGNFHLWRVNE